MAALILFIILIVAFHVFTQSIEFSDDSKEQDAYLLYFDSTTEQQLNIIRNIIPAGRITTNEKSIRVLCTTDEKERLLDVPDLPPYEGMKVFTNKLHIPKKETPDAD